MQTEPLDGVRVTLAEDGNLFTWHIGIFGPPDTIYTGGYYKVGVGGCSCSRKCDADKERKKGERGRFVFFVFLLSLFFFFRLSPLSVNGCAFGRPFTLV